MKPCKSADYFIKVIFHIVVDIIYLLWKIRPISVKGWKPVWIRACPIVLLVTLQQLAIVRLNVGTYECESRTFFIMNFLNFLGESRRAGKLLFDDSNKTGMGFALKRDLFYFGFFFVATAEFRLGFGRSRDVLTLNNIDRNQRSLGRP